jgi:chaperonin GroEL (HSP60 family)
LHECGVLDSVGVARGALEAAASVAATMMTTERIVFVQ